MDLAYLGLIVGFFAVSALLVSALDHLRKPR